MTDDEQHLLHVRVEFFDLRVESPSQCHRLVQHDLRRCSPFVDRELDLVGVPHAACPQRRDVVVGQLLPGRRSIETESRVEQRSLQLNKSGQPRHHLARPGIVEKRPERYQRIAKGVVTREGLHRRP